VRHAHDGSITPLVAVILALCASMAVAVGQVGERLVIDERARIVAEAASLAGIYGGIDAAERVARRNDGIVVAFVDSRDRDGKFQTTVSFSDRRAMATAVDTWTSPTPTLEP
jgi:hypothetical protein